MSNVYTEAERFVENLKRETTRTLELAHSQAMHEARVELTTDMTPPEGVEDDPILAMVRLDVYITITGGSKLTDEAAGILGAAERAGWRVPTWYSDRRSGILPYFDNVSAAYYALKNYTDKVNRS